MRGFYFVFEAMDLKIVLGDPVIIVWLAFSVGDPISLTFGVRVRAQ